MKTLEFEYLVSSDILYIKLSRKKSSIGDEEFEDDVIIFREPKTKKILGIEILNFLKFSNNYIQISKKEGIDFTKPFNIVRAFALLQENFIENPTEFDKTIKEIFENWGYKLNKLKSPAQYPNKFDIPFKEELKTKRLEQLV